MLDQSHLNAPNGLRCEGCGYSLDGLPSNGVCSECGLDIAVSLPRVRAGTPWQQQAGFRSLIRTWWLLLRDDACWREMRINRTSRRAFIGWIRALAYSILLLAVSWQVLLESGGKVTNGSFTYLVFLMIVPMLVVEISMRFYQEFLKWRLMLGTKFRDECQEVAAHEQVLDHACVGMMIVPVFFAMGLVCINIGIMVEGAMGLSVALAVGFYSGAGLALLGLVIGVAFFERSYRRGWRVMRYRCLTNGESSQMNDDDYEYIDETIEDEFEHLGYLRRSSNRYPVRFIDFVSGLILKCVLVPAVFIVVWQVYGLSVVTALFLAVLAFGVLSILQRLLMVPVCLMVRRWRT